MKQKWNDQWKVWKEDNAFRLIFSVPETAKEVDLPYDAVFHQEQRADSVNQGRTGFLDGGVFNYYKQYFAAEEDPAAFGRYERDFLPKEKKKLPGQIFDE